MTCGCTLLTVQTLQCVGRASQTLRDEQDFTFLFNKNPFRSIIVVRPVMEMLLHEQHAIDISKPYAQTSVVGKVLVSF